MADDNQSDSQLTTSSNEDSVNISFEDLNSTVRHGFIRSDRKSILKDVSGSFNAGELSVILGPSGAGKSSLLNILAGYSKQTTGNIYINGQLRNVNAFRRRSCYILQDDVVQDLLTIQESLYIAAELKLGNHISKQQKQRRIDEIILSLGLNVARNTRACKLSGGQRKRLAIGLELVSDPPVMILDEPTSGLDLSISKQTIYVLHLLARQGRTIIISMHQPSAVLLKMVDRIYAVVAGRCAYMGSTTELLPFLKELDMVCPSYHNPIDFLIEKCIDNGDRLVEHSKNGKSSQWLASVSQKTEIDARESNYYISEDVCLTNLPPPKENATRKILLKLKSTYATSYWKQFTTLTWRTFLCFTRNPHLAIMSAGIHCLMALFVGILFYNTGYEAQYIRDTYNYLYYSLMFLMFTAFSSVSIYFPEQLPLVRREHFNRWYTTGAFYSSTLVTAMPQQTIYVIVYSIISYWMTGLPYEILRFSGFLWTLILVTNVAVCFGFLNGSLFTVKNGVIFGPLFIMPFTIFSGFFIRVMDAPRYLLWLFEVSFLKHGLVGLVVVIFGLDRPKLACTALYCHYTYTSRFITDNGMSDESFPVAIGALISIGCLVIVTSYLVLKIRLKYKW